MKIMSRYRLLITHMLVLFLATPVVTFAGERSIDRVDLVDLPHDQEIKVFLNHPMQFLSYSPFNKADTIQVRLKPVGGVDYFDLEDSEEFFWTATAESPVQEMILEKDTDSTFTLTIHFLRKVDFKVKSGDDLRSLSIKVAKPAIARSPGDDTVVNVSTGAINLDYPYAITLQSSNAPFVGTLATTTALIDGYRVYCATLNKNGKTVCRLRVGFFKDRQAADAMLKVLKKEFPTAWVSKVTATERGISEDGIISTIRKHNVANREARLPEPPSEEAVFVSSSSFFAGVDISRPYTINLESSVGYRRFSIKIESDEMISKITDQSSSLMGPDWALKLRRKVHFEYVGSGADRRVIIQVGPGGTELQHSGVERRKAAEIVRELKIKPGIFQDYRLYTTKFITDDGKIWNRLRLGFFASRQEALDVIASLRDTFPEAWVTKASAEERNASDKRAIATASMRITPFLTALDNKSTMEKRKVAVRTLPPLSADRVLSLMEQAEQEMTAGNFSRSIQIYTRILQDSGQKERKKAQELLGLARERNGQLAHARAEYEKFLQMYPKGEDNARVKQRLAGLLTARATPKARLKSLSKRSKRYRTDIYGSVSQYYYYDELHPKDADATITRSSLANDLVFNVRKRAEKYEARTLFVGGYEVDATSSPNETRINTFYIDADDKKSVAGRFGRQSRSTGGVLGRFDGGLVSYKMTPKLKTSLVGGFPVAADGLDRFQTDKYFYGLNLDLGTLAKYWNLSTFIINQEDNGITDRQATGAEIRFFHPRVSFFALADYDLYFDDLNTALFTGNINLPNKTTINMSADYRNSPILTPLNAVNVFAGKNILPNPADLATTVQINTIDELRTYLTVDEIKEIARSATYKTSSYMLGVVQPVSKKLQVGFDVTATKIYASEDFTTSLSELIAEDTTTTPTTPAKAQTINAKIQDGKPYDYTYTMQFIGSSLVKDGDIAILSGSYRDLEDQEVYTASVNTRYPISRYWRLNPRLNATYTKERGLDSNKLKIRPLFRMDYRIRKPRVHFTLEAGGEWQENEPDDAANTTSYFGTLGYRYDF